MVRGEKKARQHAALLVLQKSGYNVSFDMPPGPSSGNGGPTAGAFGRGGGAWGRGRGGGPGGGSPVLGPPPGAPPLGANAQQARMQRYPGRSLDSRHAQAVQQARPPVSRDAYLSSLQDELG
jgi:hypothetical protein